MSGAQSSCCGAAVRACGGHRAHRHCLVQLGLLVGHLDRSGRWEHGRLGRKCVGEEGCGISLGRVAVSEGAGDWGRCRENASSRASAARARGRRPPGTPRTKCRLQVLGTGSVACRPFRRQRRIRKPDTRQRAHLRGLIPNKHCSRPPRHARNGPAFIKEYSCAF